MPEWLPRTDPLRRRDASTVDVPLGQPVVSALTGKVYRPSQLGFVDTPEPYEPSWALLAALRASDTEGAP